MHESIISKCQDNDKKYIKFYNKRMGKKNKAWREVHNQQTNMTFMVKEKKFFKQKNMKNKEKKKVNDQIVAQVDFEMEYNIDKKCNKITGRIEYEWFSISASKLIPFHQAQTPSKQSSLYPYQKQIQQKLLPINNLIQKKYFEFFKMIFNFGIWVMRDDFFEEKVKVHELCNSDSQQIEKDMKRIICLMSESKARQLVLGGFEKQLLLMLSHVTFRNLKALVLKQRVYSLEPLEWMGCPNLSSISIENSTISNLKPLAKLSSGSKLNNLLIKNTKTVSFQSLSRISTKRSSTLRVVQTVHFMADSRLVKQNILIQDICQLAKAETGWGFMKWGEKVCVNRVKQEKVAKRMVDEWLGGIEWRKGEYDDWEMESD